ncbi:MAG TPA: hypothetical protein VEA58_07335 [Anaerovoracaceae bacterium]|nr:hypothetical protein [Anaerovoracaceae bacterium]
MEGLTPHQFSLNEYYMFVAQVKRKPDVIVEKPTSIKQDEITFHFHDGQSAQIESIAKSEILAVGDNRHGKISVNGWKGRYRVLNQPLFDKYVEKGVIKTH